MKQPELFTDILALGAAHAPDQLAITCNDEGYTYKELQLAVDLFANDLIKKGLHPGDHVALWAMNHACWPIAYMGIIRAGGVAVLLNFGLPAGDIAEQMRYADTKFIVYGLNRELMLDPSAPQKMAESLNLAASCICDLRQDFHARIDQGENADVLPPENKDSRRTATIIFTTGTTGVSKAVEQSQYAMCCNSFCAHELLKERIGDRKIIALPLFHSFGLETLFFCLLHCNSIWLADLLKPDALLRTISDNQIDDITSVSSVIQGLISHPGFTAEIANRFIHTGAGGSYIAPEELRSINNAFPNAKLLYGYGQTEACTVVAMHQPSDSLEKVTTTVGKVMPCLNVDIMNPKGHCLPVGQIGEVVYRGNTVMNGYYKLSHEEQPFDVNGWLHTGDLGYLDEDGYLHITGRLKDIIIKSGENIMPSDIESKILACGGVHSAKVLGIPHPVSGESIEACIIPDPGTWQGEDELRHQLSAKLNSFMMPSHFFVYDAFPMSENGKLNQQALRSDVLAQLRNLTEAKN